MSSRNCPLKLQASIASQSQQLLEMDIAASQPLGPPASTVQAVVTAPTAPPVSTVQAVLTATTAPTASTVQAAVTAPTAPPASTVQAAVTAPTAPTASTVQAVLTAPTVRKQLSPDRPEVLMQAYLAEKTAWLAQYPTVRPTEYRKARKWKTPRPKVLKEQVIYMPKERRDLIGTIIAHKANWSNEEITVWLDNEERRQEDEYNRLQVEFDTNNKRGLENGHREIWARVVEEVARDSKRYIL